MNAIVVPRLQLGRALPNTATNCRDAAQLGTFLCADTIHADIGCDVENLLPKFRELAPRTEFIVVTGYADLDASLSALRKGVADYFIEPINPDAVLAALNRIADRRHIEREITSEREFATKILQSVEAMIHVTDLTRDVLSPSVPQAKASVSRSALAIHSSAR